MVGRVFYISSLFVLLMVGCTVVPDPTPTQLPANIAADVVTVPPRPSPTATPTVVEIVVTETASMTPTIQSTATATLWPTPTPKNLPQLIWDENIDEMAVVKSRRSAWSPITNELVFDNCSYTLEILLETQVISFLDAPTFEPENIDLVDVGCSFTTEFLWYPDGQRILFSGVSLPGKDYLSSDIFVMDRGSKEVWYLGQAGNWLDFVGWLDSNTLVYQDYWGMANWQAHLLDINKGEEIARAYIYGFTVSALTEDFVIADTISSDRDVSAVYFGREIIRSNDDFNWYQRKLSQDETDVCCNHVFNSSVVDFIPYTNQVIVRTWDAKPLPETLHIETDLGLWDAETDLQLWDIETNELTMLIPDGIDGKFSPNGRYLAYQLVGEEFSPIRLLDRNSGEILLVAPAKYSSESFSPNGRFLTFVSPSSELKIYDLEQSIFLPSVSDAIITSKWSPDSTRFVYEDANNGLSIYEVETQTTYPLAASGVERLSNPQWSFDGTYLSVVVSHQGNGEMKTAVLQLP